MRNELRYEVRNATKSVYQSDSYCDCTNWIKYIAVNHTQDPATLKVVTLPPARSVTGKFF